MHNGVDLAAHYEKVFRNFNRPSSACGNKKDGKVFDPVILLNLIQKRNIYYYKS